MAAQGLVPPGTFPRPGPIGRTVRILVGLALLYFCGQAIRALPTVLRDETAYTPLFWLGGALAFYALPMFIDPTYGPGRGRPVQRGMLFLGLLAAAADLLVARQVPGPWLARLVDLLLLYTTAHAGLAFLLAGLFAVPG